jgi:hypothetical protein
MRLMIASFACAQGDIVRQVTSKQVSKNLWASDWIGSHRMMNALNDLKGGGFRVGGKAKELGTIHCFRDEPMVT